MSIKKAEPYWPLILLLALVKFVLPLFLQSPVYELHRDEFLYYAQGQHAALGYLENPPLIGWLAMISSWMGGSTAWIKFWPCLFGAATVILTCLITAELGGRRFAQFLAALGIITGALMRAHFLFQPNMLDIFSWTLALYFLTRYINDRSTASIYGLALSLALGWWSKYSVLFMIVAIVAALLLTRNRRIFIRPATWKATIIAIILVLPNLWWQFEHNWPLIHHMKELKETQLDYVNPLDFLKEQVLLFLPALLVWVAGLVWVWRRSQLRALGIVYVMIIGLLMLGSGKGYYAFGVYPMLLAAGAVVWERITENRRWLRAGIAVFIILIGALLTPLILPVYPPAKLASMNERYDIENKWEDQKLHPLSQDFADMLGWKEIALKTERFYNSLPVRTKQRTIIFGGSYGQAGALRYYASDKNFRNKVISANGSFILWMPEKNNFDNMLLVVEKTVDEVFSAFEKVTIVDSVTNAYSRQAGDRIYWCERVYPQARTALDQRFLEMKKTFQR